MTISEVEEHTLLCATLSSTHLTVSLTLASCHDTLVAPHHLASHSNPYLSPEGVGEQSPLRAFNVCSSTSSSLWVTLSEVEHRELLHTLLIVTHTASLMHRLAAWTQTHIGNTAQLHNELLLMHTIVHPSPRVASYRRSCCT